MSDFGRQDEKGAHHWTLLNALKQFVRVVYVEGRFVEEKFFEFPQRFNLEEIKRRGQLRVTVPRYILSEIVEGATGRDLHLMIGISRYRWDGPQQLHDEELREVGIKVG